MTPLMSTTFATSTKGGITDCLKTMPKGKIAAILCVPLLLVEAVFVPAAIALDGKKLYQLCSRFPLNYQCQGYQTPISFFCKRPVGH
jgi:hypothetical protein